MLKVISKGLWKTIAAKARNASVKRGAIAYVGSSPPIRFGDGDTLVVDASEASIKAARTSARVLSDFRDKGAEIYSREDLHAKVLLLDDWAIVGSANASSNTYTEAAIVTDRGDVAGQVEQFITALCTEATRITNRRMRHLLSLPVTRRMGRRGKRDASAPALSATTTWLVSLRGDGDYRGDSDKVDRVGEEEGAKVGKKAGKMDWFFTGLSDYSTARPGDHFIQLWRPRKRITTTRSVRVLPPARLLRIYREPRASQKTFHVLLPSRAGRRAISWTKFLSLAKRVGLTRPLSYRSNVRLTEAQSAALTELWPQ